MFLKSKEELVQTSIHRNGINIAVKTRVGGRTAARWLKGTTELSSHVDGVTHSGNELPCAALRWGLRHLAQVWQCSLLRPEVA